MCENWIALIFFLLKSVVTRGTRGCHRSRRCSTKVNSWTDLRGAQERERERESRVETLSRFLNYMVTVCYSMVCKDQWTTFGLYISTYSDAFTDWNSHQKPKAFAAAHCSSCVSYHPIPRAHLVQWQLVSMRMMFLTSFAVTWPSIRSAGIQGQVWAPTWSTFGCSDSSVDSTNICKCHSYLRWFSYTWSEMTPSVFPIGAWASEKVKLDLGTPKTSGGVSRFHHCWHTHIWLGLKIKDAMVPQHFNALCIMFPYFST